MVLEKTLESPLDCKEIQLVNPEGNQSWVFIGRTDVEIDTPILWPPDEKSWLIWKDPDARKDWGQEEKGTTEDEMVGWHHQLNGHEFVLTPGVGDGQGGLVCWGSWGHRESDVTERLSWAELVPKKLRCLCAGRGRELSPSKSWVPAKSPSLTLPWCVQRRVSFEFSYLKFIKPSRYVC